MNCVINDSTIGPNVAWSSEKCKEQIENVLKERLIQRPLNYKEGNLAQFNSFGEIIDSRLKVDDSLKGGDILWSSEKTEDEIKKTMSDLVMTTSTFVPNSFIVYDTDGKLKSSEYTLNDDALPSEKNIYSSKKLGSIIEDISLYTIPKFKEVPDGLICMTGKNGGIDVSRGYKIDDSQTDLNILWSSKKISDYLDTNVHEKFKTVLNEQKSENEKISKEFNLKMDKIIGNAENIPVFDSTGNLKDSGMKFDDEAEPSPEILWTSNKISKLFKDDKFNKCLLVPTEFTEGNIAYFDSNGHLKDSGYVIDDSKCGNNILWTSEKQVETCKKINSEFQSKVKMMESVCEHIKNTKMQKTCLLPNYLLKTNDRGELVSSDFVVDDNSKPLDNVLWSAKKIKEMNFAKMDSNVKSGNLALLSNDKIIDSGLRIDDNCTTKNCLWTAEKIDRMLKEKEFVLGDIEDLECQADWSSVKYKIKKCHDSDKLKDNKSYIFEKGGYYMITVYGRLDCSGECNLSVSIKTNESHNFLSSGNMLVNFCTIEYFYPGDNLCLKMKSNRPDFIKCQEIPLKFCINQL
jgi:hypothetical protein